MKKKESALMQQFYRDSGIFIVYLSPTCPYSNWLVKDLKILCHVRPDLRVQETWTIWGGDNYPPDVKKTPAIWNPHNQQIYIASQAHDFIVELCLMSSSALSHQPPHTTHTPHTPHKHSSSPPPSSQPPPSSSTQSNDQQSEKAHRLNELGLVPADFKYTGEQSANISDAECYKIFGASVGTIPSDLPQ